MNPPRQPRDSAPSIITVILTLMVAVAVCFGSVLVMERMARWSGWVGQ